MNLRVYSGPNRLAIQYASFALNATDPFKLFNDDFSYQRDWDSILEEQWGCLVLMQTHSTQGIDDEGFRSLEEIGLSGIALQS